MTEFPALVRRYRPRDFGGVPDGVQRWGFKVGRPPYTALQGVRSVQDLATALSRRGEPPRGVILVGEPVDVGPYQNFVEVDWLRASLPWSSLVLVVPDEAKAGLLAMLLTKIVRHGAVVFPSGPLVPGEVVRAIRAMFRPDVELPPWLEATLPRWPVKHRERAVRLFGEGFTYDSEYARVATSDARPASRQALWVQIGRAMRAALLVQAPRHGSWSRLALEAGYAHLTAMDRALERAFGVSREQIVGTVGWEWLLWRFLCGLGDGRRKGWNR